MSQAAPIHIERDGFALAGETMGEGPAIVLVHGLSATRAQVVHGSKALPRAGFATSAYDARGHGASGVPPGNTDYGYKQLADDLDAVIDAVSAESRCVAVGHSMGAHTIAALGLSQPDRLAGIVLVGPAYLGVPAPADTLARWDELADGLEHGGVEGFLRAYERDLSERWRETVLRFTRARLERHEHPEAVAQALREVPRSEPFGGLDELEFCELPALVVASHDDADPSHPHAVAEQWAEKLPQASCVSESPGESPLAWQGGKLSREIAAFCESPEVVERLRG
jgi:pimeloyl-ACP methyl ester carboxylesterase